MDLIMVTPKGGIRVSLKRKKKKKRNYFISLRNHEQLVKLFSKLYAAWLKSLTHVVFWGASGERRVLKKKVLVIHVLGGNNYFRVVRNKIFWNSTATGTTSAFGDSGRLFRPACPLSLRCCRHKLQLSTRCR